MTEKTVNYSPEMIEQMQSVYVPTAAQDLRNEQIAKLANAFNKSTRSVIAKLTSLGLYVPKAYVTKKGVKPVTKEMLVAKLEKLTGADLQGLETAPKGVINSIIEIIENLMDENPEEEETEETE